MNEGIKRTPEEIGIAMSVATMLVLTGAVSIDVDNPRPFTSGIQGPLFTDCTHLLGLPGQRSLVANMLTERVRKVTTNYNYDSVMGVPTGAPSFATMVADRLGKKNPYWNEKKGRMEGNFKSGDKVVIIEDMGTTGRSTIAFAEKVREWGGIVEKVVLIASYGLPEIDENFRNAGLEYASLTDMDAIYEVLKKRGKLSDRETEVLKVWMQNPRAWRPNQT